MAMVSPAQYPFSLLNIKPKNTARPKESEHLNANLTISIFGRLTHQLLQILLKPHLASSNVSLGSSLLDLSMIHTGFPLTVESSWRSFIQNRKKEAVRSLQFGLMVGRDSRNLLKSSPFASGAVVALKGKEGEEVRAISIPLIGISMACNRTPGFMKRGFKNLI